VIVQLQHQLAAMVYSHTQKAAVTKILFHAIMMTGFVNELIALNAIK
jgi:hypothetical protein